MIIESNNKNRHWFNNYLKNIKIEKIILKSIEPNHNISEMVNRAIARYAERIERQFEMIENQFKSINEEIELRIFSASKGLDNDLKSIDNSLLNILKDKNLVDTRIILKSS